MTKELVLTESREGKRACSAWWSELLQVDFRHALWPWLLYCALLFVDPSTWDWYSIAVPVALVLTQAGVIVRVFGMDFDQGTMGRFMSFPVGRGRTWAVKIVLVFLLVMLPPVATVMAVGAGQAGFAIVVGSFGFFMPGVGSLMTMILKRNMLAWSATALTPFFILLITGPLLELLGVHLDANLRDEFPYMPMPFLVGFPVCGGVALGLSWRTWQRLEVVS